MSESYGCFANSDHSSVCIHHINKHTLGHADGKYSSENALCVRACLPQAGVWLSLKRTDCKHRKYWLQHQLSTYKKKRNKTLNPKPVFNLFISFSHCFTSCKNTRLSLLWFPPFRLCQTLSSCAHETYTCTHMNENLPRTYTCTRWNIGDSDISLCSRFRDTSFSRNLLQHAQNRPGEDIKAEQKKKSGEDRLRCCVTDSRFDACSRAHVS